MPDREQLAATITADPNAPDGSFVGMASVFGSVAMGARGPTRFEPGAFAETIHGGNQFPLLWQHQDHMPVGVIERLRETDMGLEMKGRITQNTFGKDVLALLRDGAVTGLSIGFDAKQARFEKHSELGQLRVVEKARLHEVSLVTFPADKAARVRTVHLASRGRVTQVAALLRELLADQPPPPQGGDPEAEATVTPEESSEDNLTVLTEAVKSLVTLMSRTEGGLDAIEAMVAECRKTDEGEGNAPPKGAPPKKGVPPPPPEKGEGQSAVARVKRELALLEAEVG